MGFYSFCGSVLWDEYQTWNTTDPDFSPCFHKTGLVWISCGILWLLSPLEIIFMYKQRPQYIPWTGLSIFKLLLNFLLIVNSLCVLSHMFLDPGPQIRFYLADYWAYGIKAITYCLATILVICDKKSGVHSSGVLFIFWLVASACGGITYRSYLVGLMAKDVSTDEFIFIANMVAFPLLVAQLILAFFVDTVINVGKVKNECPLKDSSFPSVALFGWFDALVWKGYRTELTEKDMWALDDEFRATTVQKSFDLVWKQQKKKFADITKKNPSFLSLLWHRHKIEIFMGYFLKIFADLLTFASPLMLRQLIDFVSDSKEPVWKGYLYTVTLFVASVTATICMHNYFFRLQSIGISARAAVISTIYRKALRMSTAAKRTSTTGEVVNLMSVDSQRVMDVWPYVGFLVSTPLTVFLALYMLWTLLGPSVLAGITVIIIVVPLNLCLARIISRLQTQLMRLKDDRIKLINEILGGIKILKLYAWELSFTEQINEIRANELKILKKILYLEAVTNFLFSFSPFLIALSTFATFVLSDENNVLDAAKAFVSIALFDLIRFPLALVPMIVSYLIQASVSFKRLDKFMASAELDSMQIRENITDDGYVINVDSATFSWALDEGPVLRNINLRVAPQSLIAVVGTVGAGKSSLISAMLGEMEKISGKITRKGSVAYVSQQAWIQNATVRENILFGLPMDENLYSKILDLCALRQDLDVLPGGDQTEIGEKGINLSGGQKQRISLARAVYNNADIYLLDDPLSAVDAHVGKHIFDNVIGPNGILCGKTRILVTHGISFLPHVDCVVVLSDGAISEIGSYKFLVEKSGAFAEFLMTYLKEDQPIDEMDAAELLEIQQGLLSDNENRDINRRLSVRISRALSSDDELLAEGTKITRRRSSRLNSLKESRSNQSSLLKQQSLAALINKEQTESGSVGWNVYIYYFRSCGLVLCIFAVCVFALSWTASVSANVWLSFWSGDKPNPDGSQNVPLRDLRLSVYASLGTGQVVCSLLGAMFLLRATVRASGLLHGNMLSNILHAPMSFFDTTPLGRVLNRFSRDVDVVDATIPMFLRPFIDSSLQIVGVIAVICFSTPIFAVALVPISIIYYFIQRVFIGTSRQLKRLESVSRSPIFSHFSETLSGLPTIRAYKVQNQFIVTSDKRLDVNNGLLYPFLVAKRWLAVRLEFVGSLVVLASALLAVIGRDSLAAGTVGLSVSYALSVTLILTMLVRNWTEVESNSISIERIKEYTELSSEAAWERDEFKPLSSWPAEGEVKFENYSTRYRNGLPLVLKSITCDIHSGEKIGVVGRTGAGKSSFTLALFRLIEASDGVITIDGVNIGKIGLYDLRSKLTIIPQDPVLFFGSLRTNLDPFSKHTDEDIWRALEQSHLKDFVVTLSAGLQHRISEGGDNLSVGQRQLVCLARALLRKTKLLILDEATAAVDLETDDLIQATIRKEFADCTIITIAHRLNTIMDSDRVMVLENGIISEFDSPSELLQNKNSIFYSMAKDAGLV